MLPLTDNGRTLFLITGICAESEDTTHKGRVQTGALVFNELVLLRKGTMVVIEIADSKS